MCGARGLPASARVPALARPGPLPPSSGLQPPRGPPVRAAAQRRPRTRGRRQTKRAAPGNGREDREKQASRGRRGPRTYPEASRSACRSRALAAAAAARGTARIRTGRSRRRALLDPEVHITSFRDPPTPPIGWNHRIRVGKKVPKWRKAPLPGARGLEASETLVNALSPPRKTRSLE